MPGPLGHQLRLSACRPRPRAWPSSIQLRAPAQTRHFGLSQAAGHLLSASEWLFTNAHQLTAAPWYLSIPLVALVTNATIRTPVTLLSIGTARRRARLAPLIQAQTAMVGLGLRKKKTPNPVEMLANITQKRTKQLYQNLGETGRGTFWASLLSVPVFLSNIEVLRRMCGGPRGLFGRLLLGSPTTDDNITVPTTEPGELVASASSSVQQAITVEPALADGGCLWFPNLLEADPYHILPFAVSAMMVFNLLPASIAGVRNLFGLEPSRGQVSGSTASRTGMAFQRAMLLLSLSLGPITMDLPAAIHLYWFSSSASTFLINKGLRKLNRVPKNSIEPCRGRDIPMLRPKAPARLKKT